MIKFKVGDMVKYDHKWCTENEKKYIFVVAEVYENVMDGLNRYKIGCLNTTLSLGCCEVVDEEMIRKAEPEV